VNEQFAKQEARSLNGSYKAIAKALLAAYAAGVKAGEDKGGYRAGFDAGLNVVKCEPPGHIIDDAGVVRKVLGTPWLTDDGAWIGKDARVWVLCRPLNNDDYGWLACPAKMGHDPEDATSPVPWWQVESPTEWRWCEQYEIKGVYSTREAADAARKECQP